MVLSAAASRTFTGFGPMLQPLPSTSEYSCRVTLGSGSPTLIMGGSPKKKRPTLWAVSGSGAGSGLDRGGLFDQAGRDPVLGLGDRAALGDLDHVARVELALFVMGVVFARLGNDLAVELVLD